MATQERELILDTSIIFLMIRAGKLGKYIDEQYHIRSRAFRPLISVVTVGELYAIAARNNWGEKKLALIDILQRELVVVDINRPDVLKAYAEVLCAAELKGKKLGQNDLWIAATAKVTHTSLLTTDKDFDPLYPDHIDRIWIDPAIGKSS